MKLSYRLQVLCDCVSDNAIVADIGCDHAQLCIHLVNSNKCKKAYACDVNEGPLQQAKKNIEHYKVSDKIILCLSDGLEKVEDDVSDVVIAGMGFETIQMILNKDLHKITNNRRFIVQANKDVEGLRLWISQHNFKIEKELVIKEENHYYQIIVFTNEVDTALSEHELRFGRAIKKDFTFYSMWKFRLSKLEKVLRSLDVSNPQYNHILNEMFSIYNEFGSE